MSTDLEALKRQANALADALNVEARAEVALLLIEAHKGFVAAIAALERAERVEAAAMTFVERLGAEPEGTHQSHLWAMIRAVLAEFRAALAPAPEDSEECQHEFGALGAVSGDHCIHCGKRLSNEAGWPTAAPGEEWASPESEPER